MNARVLAKMIAEPSPFNTVDQVLVFFKEIITTKRLITADYYGSDPRHNPKHREYFGK